MVKKLLLSIAVTAILVLYSSEEIASAQTAATVPVNVTVNGALVITDASNDSMSGINPNINVSLSVTPDLGAAIVTGQANFRIRTNRTTWRLTAQRTVSNAGSTGIADTDVTLSVVKSAGSTGNANAGMLVSPFTALTNLNSIPTASSAGVVSGTAKTSSTKDGTNTNNYFQVNTTYGIAPDFFYSPGTYSTIITYNLISP
ncbi:MAG: hypothetical protein A3I68_04025 [Candidatus Melainabacteria bacterium RIFCSPLOWO2_02_FULL_35_15]|nr:MAG: hypothetical protein A3F80_01535 [Candidatus Melainabacteria bacterium RIFCSPLOWO2_12_FULL_35_11]OGI13139.1 MAG: hypothetical protein A3I68_04025 [Candidatus Melainabacteria bacterium RIFCSPLOWO2_02_FULL_35_15]